MTGKPVAYVDHVLGNIHTLRIIGWSGNYTVEDAKGSRVEVVAEKRHEGESWIFGVPARGILVCRTNLINPRLRTTRDPADDLEWQMAINVPPKYRSGLNIEIDRSQS